LDFNFPNLRTFNLISIRRVDGDDMWRLIEKILSVCPKLRLLSYWFHEILGDEYEKFEEDKALTKIFKAMANYGNQHPKRNITFIYPLFVESPLFYTSHLPSNVRQLEGFNLKIFPIRVRL